MGRILVVGVGNTIMGDDGLGVHALRALCEKGVPPNVDVVEAGTALLNALPDLEGYDKIILLDAVNSEEDGVSVIRNPEIATGGPAEMSLHDLGISEALGLRLLEDGDLPEVVVIGSKPGRMEFGDKLSSGALSKISELVDAVMNEISGRNEPC